MVDGGFSFGRLFASRYLRESLFFVGLQQAFQVGVGLLQVWILTNHLSREAYGVWGYVAAFAAMANIFTLPGLNQVITYGAANLQHGVLMAGVRLRLSYGLLSSVVLLGLAWSHAGSDQAQAAGLLLITALFMPICQVMDSMDAFLTGLGNFKALFWRRVLLQGSLSLSLWAGAVFTGSLWVCGAILYGGGALISTLLFVSLLKHRQNTLLPDRFQNLTRQFSLQSIGATISRTMERPLLSLMVGFHDLAAYNVALTAQVPVTYGRLIDRILISRLTGLRQKIDASWVWFGVGVLFGIGWPAWLLLVMVVRWLVPIVFPGYVDAIPLMEILLLQIPFSWGAKPGLSWLLAHAEYHAWYHRLNWGTILARILLIAAGAWQGGMTGVAWAWVGVEGLTFCAVLLVLSKAAVRGPSE
ncbi:MAG: oligosaccharide flippase family protein [Magnetococcales bacterium]|nr:oligosaccharide flippase family protein [Magnetococcales bacterium]